MGIWRSAPKDAPIPQGAGFSGRRKDPFPDGSRDRAVPRHVQQKRAALLVHFPKLSFALASSAPGNTASHERKGLLCWPGSQSLGSSARPSSWPELGWP